MLNENIFLLLISKNELSQCSFVDKPFFGRVFLVLKNLIQVIIRRKFLF